MLCIELDRCLQFNAHIEVICEYVSSLERSPTCAYQRCQEARSTEDSRRQRLRQGRPGARRRRTAAACLPPPSKRRWKRERHSVQQKHLNYSGRLRVRLQRLEKQLRALDQDMLVHYRIQNNLE